VIFLADITIDSPISRIARFATFTLLG